mmetsp:Transcript_5362/g.6203  ORF Transcript_5362/g.6203 Transcript_5362/m.6203 type:complete len:111 (+) Transcript_5362:80-412(+)
MWRLYVILLCCACILLYVGELVQVFSDRREARLCVTQPQQNSLSENLFTSNASISLVVVRVCGNGGGGDRETTTATTTTLTTTTALAAVMETTAITISNNEDSECYCKCG